MAGLVYAGPWLTMVGARALARRTKRLPTLIAARRLADNPKAGFRSVSGLILALFVTTVAVGVIGTINAQRNTTINAAETQNLVQNFDHASIILRRRSRRDAVACVKKQLFHYL